MSRHRPQFPHSREPILIAALLAISLLVNVLYISNLELSAADLETGDARFYHRAGTGIAEILTHPVHYLPALVRGELGPEEMAGLGLGDDYDSGLLRSPAYGILLGFLYALFGQDIRVVVVAQGVLLTLSVLLLYVLGRRLFGSGVGFLAALFAVGYSSFLLFVGRVLTETLTLSLLLLSTLLLVVSLRSTALRWPQLAGAATAALLLTKISMRFFLPLLFAVFVVLLWREGRSIMFRRAGSFVLGLLYIFVPWLIFTTLVFDRPLLTVPPSSGPMHTLYRGNYVPEDGWENDGLGDMQSPELAEAITVAAPGDWERGAVYVAATRKAIQNDPGGFLVLVLKKIYRMWHRPAELWRASLGFVHLPQQVLWHRIVLIVGLLGMGYAVVDRRAVLPLVLAILYITALYAVSRVEARFQVPVMPFVFLFAAGMVDYARRYMRDWLRAIRRPSVLFVLLALLLFLLAAGLINMGHLAAAIPAAGSRMHHYLALLPGLAALALSAVLLCLLYREHLSTARACVAGIAPVVIMLLPWGGQAAGDIAWREWRCRLDSPDQKVVQEIVLPSGLDLRRFTSAALQIDMLGSPGKDCDLRVTIDGREVGRFRRGLAVDERKFIYPRVLNPLQYRRLHEGLHAVLTEVRRLHPRHEAGLEYFRQWHRIPFDPDLLRGKQRVRIEIGLVRAGGADDYIEIFGDYPPAESEEQRQFVGPSFARTLYETSTDKLRMFAADRYRADYRLWQTTQVRSVATQSSRVRSGRADTDDLSPSGGRQYGEYRIRLELRGRGCYHQRKRPDGRMAYEWLFEFQRTGNTSPVPVKELRKLQRVKYEYYSGYLVF